MHSVNQTESSLKPAPDRKFLIDLKNFNYTINTKSCNQLGIQPKFIILIHSAPKKRANRDNIRFTWGGWKVDHRVIFLLGAVSDQNLQRELEIESALFEDMVQGNFVDTYKNLSYKHIMAMKWATEFCPETQFIFKSDDDIFVNTPLMLQFVENAHQKENFMFCVISRGQPVMRDKNSKWYVSPSDFPNEIYPVYCSGCGVLLSIDVAAKLHKMAEKTPFFWVDDVYVLGILREKISVKITPIAELHMGTQISDEIIAEKRNNTEVLKYMFSYELKNEQIQQMWEVVKYYTDRGLSRKTRTRSFIIILVVLMYTFFVWNFAKSHNFTLNLVQTYNRMASVQEPAEPAFDRKFLIDLKNFNYTINTKSCYQLGIQPKFIILIHSAPKKRANRDNIRFTWGGWKVDHRVIYLLGAVSDQNLQRELEIESALFEDMVQGNFVDTYKNLSYKHIMAMKWATEFCPETQFIFKSDDDIFVNTPLMLQFVENAHHKENFMFCVISWKPPVIRNKNSKWYVSPKEYPKDRYPVYCPGCGVLLSIDVAAKLHKMAEKTPFFWVDDVYVLGILREKIGVRITHIAGLHMGSKISDEIIAQKRNNTEILKFMFSFELTNEQIKKMWDVVKYYTDRGYYSRNRIN
ncbi:Hexosyltransferase [Sergentomyia squamirostris]